MQKIIGILLLLATKTPKNFKLSYGNYFNIQSQKLNSKFARICPYNSYALKEYRLFDSLFKKINFIVETDDDNGPKKNFFKKITVEHKVKSIKNRDGLIYMIFFYKKKLKFGPEDYH